MERDINDVNNQLTPDEINEMEEHRIQMLNEAGIDEKEVLEQSSRRINSWTSYFNENITRGKDDINFTIRDQWTAIERSEFTRLFKPAMTFNKLYDNVKKIAGEQRKNKPDLIVRSLNGKATQEEINLRADLVRTISYQSQNDLVYQTAFKSALMLGFGAFQICLDYESPRSFNRIVRYDIINDPTMCAWDAGALKPHKGDGNFCSRRFIMSRDEFFATYPYVTNPVSFTDAYLLLDFQKTKDNIILCDDYVKEWFPVLIYKLSNGEVVTADEWKEREKRFEDNKEIVEGSIVGEIIKREIPKIVGERQTQDYRIMHYRMLKNQIVDFSEWPSKHLPIPFVDGDSYYIEGRQYTKSFIHEARDAQKCVNYFNSEIAAEVKNRRREQWIGTPDNIKGYEQLWRNPEIQTGILVAQPDPKTSMMPTRQAPWDLSPALLANAQRATQDIREILGFSETEALQGRDVSGKARRERKLEGSMSAYVFFDNLNQAVEQGGRVVNDLLNYIIGDEERNLVVSRKDGRTESIVINQMTKDGNKINTLGTGDFDVEIDTGPSFAVQKDMAIEFFQETISAYPQTFPLIADLWAKNLDVQYMQQIADRFKTLVPPQILAKEEGKELPPQPPSPQEQMMQQEMQMRQQQIIERAEELRIRQEKHELEKAELIMKSKELMEKMNSNTRKDAIEMRKADMDFSSKIAKILSDLRSKH